MRVILSSFHKKTKKKHPKKQQLKYLLIGNGMFTYIKLKLAVMSTAEIFFFFVQNTTNFERELHVCIGRLYPRAVVLFPKFS